MSHKSFGIVLAFALFFGVGPIHAQDSTDVSAWVEKMAQCTTQSLSYDFSLNFDLDAMGMSVASTGSIVMKDKRHLHMTSKTTVKAPQMPKGGQKMEQKMVMDGTTMWTLTTMNHPVNRGEKFTSVSRMSIELMEKIGEQATGMSSGIPGAGGSTDMASQIRTMFDEFYTDCKLTIADGVVKISGNISDEFMEKFPMGGFELSRFTADLDEKTAFPLRMTMGSDKNEIIKMSMSNPKFLEQKEIDMKLFKYIPEPGVHVMDMDAMLKAMVPVDTEPSAEDF